MDKPLRVLHLEDNPDYSKLVGSMLEDEGVSAEVVLVDNHPDFLSALEREPFDIVLADYSLPSCNGLQALQSVRLKWPDMPFLLVSGTIGEQAAIESLRCGATDYVLKQWPERLVPAVRRAIQEAEEKRNRRHAETELVRREKYFRTLTENSLDLLSILNGEGVICYSSPSVKRLLGYEPKDLAGKTVFSLVHPEDLARVREAFERGMAHPNETETVEFRIRCADGAWRDLESVGRNRLDDPEIAGVVVHSRDISERKRAEASLRRSEQQYRVLFDGNPNPMWVFDSETYAFLEINKAAIQHYGYSRDEFLAMTVKDIRPAEEIPELLAQHARMLRNDCDTGELRRFWRHRHKDGTLIDVEIKWSPILFEGRAATLTLASDVTQRRRLEHRDSALSSLGRSLSSATSPVEAAHIIKQIADDLFRWDVFTLDLYSAERDEIQPILNIDLIDGKRTEMPRTALTLKPSGMARRIVRNGPELILREEPLRMPPDVNPLGDKSRPSASLMLVPIRNREVVIGLLSIQSYTLKAYDRHDLTTLQALGDYCGGALERIRAEQALRESEERFRDLFHGSPDAIFVENLEGVVLDVNPAACHLHGVSREQLVGRPVSSLAPPDKQSELQLQFRQFVTSESSQIEGVRWTGEGREVPVEIRASRIEYGGEPAMLLHVRDVSERKQAEAALRSSEMLFHSVWENSVDGMRLTDENGVIVAVNAAFCKLAGMSREELEGQPFTVIYAESEHPEKILEKYRKRFHDRVIERQIERKLTLRNGNIVVLEDTNSFVELRGRPPLLLGLFRDVTAQKRLEEQFRQSQKMEAIGQLAGGVAHDFNNILTVIAGHASLLLSAGNLTGPPARSAQQIAQAAERAAGLTRQLLTFSRRQVMQLTRLDINEVVSHMTRMLGRILGEDILLQLNYWPQPALVQADASMMEQVLLNLAVNARDAMPKGGQLSIKISALHLDQHQIMHHPEARPGRFICLSVTDTGSGIAPENLRRVFDPFFTTKEVGKGTGLGLATVYGIVKQHQGWIEVESEVGVGSVFRVYLPASAEQRPALEEKPTDQAVRGGSETILVVEDEKPVRELVCSLLSTYGYRVLQAESGLKALEVWRENKNRIQLLLTDLVMPDRLNGRELAEKLWADEPTLKVIFTSGYSADVVGKDFVLRAGMNYLQKPYPPQKLAVTVRDCLDR